MSFGIVNAVFFPNYDFTANVVNQGNLTSRLRVLMNNHCNLTREIEAEIRNKISKRRSFIVLFKNQHKYFYSIIEIDLL